MPDTNTEALTPYARTLGIRVEEEGGDAPILAYEFSGDVEGRPQHLHGGATSGLLETAGYAVLKNELERLGRQHRLKPINITVQFLSAGKMKTTYAQGRITRLGRRNANISVEAWQDDRERPIATAILNILMAGDE